VRGSPAAILQAVKQLKPGQPEKACHLPTVQFEKAKSQRRAAQMITSDECLRTRRTNDSSGKKQCLSYKEASN
jgi:hypothetical protein